MIAISYRREDCTPIAGRLHDRLRAEFGKENVFMDFDSIPYGVDFRDHIAQTLEGADILVAVIGPGWLGHRVGESTRRIDDATDFVRLEIAGALQRGIPVIPILVDETSMPMEDTLPDDLKPLVFRNALMLDSGIDFHHHADRLITGIRSLLKNIQSASRHGSKERSRSSPGYARDSDDRRAAAGRFKWLGMLDRLRSPAPSQRQGHEHGVKPTSLTSAAEPVTAAPKEISAQSGGTEAGARETAQSETSQAIESDRDFERYGGGANERPKKQLAPLAGSAPELAPPPVTAPAVSVQQSSIAPPPPRATIAQPSGALKKPQNSFFGGKLLGLVLAGAVVGFVTYFAVISKIKSKSTRTEAVVQSALPAPESSALITPDVASSAPAAVQPSVQPLASGTPLEVPSPSPPGDVNERQTTKDNTTSATASVSPSSSATPAILQPSEANGQQNKSVTLVDEETVRQFVRDYYAALSRRDLNAVVSKYADAVDYQGQGHHDRKYIRTDMANYFRRWDKIVFDGGDISISQNGDGSVVVSFNFPFAVAKGLASAKRGLSSQVWVLREEPPGNLQIVSQREKVIAGQPKQRKSRH